MSFWDSITDILNKLTPNRNEAYVDELNELVVDYDKALELGEDTKAATIRKKMVVLRKKLGIKDE